MARCPALVAGHLPALGPVAGVAEQAAHEGRERHAAQEGGAVLAVGGEDQSCGRHGGRRAEDGRLLADGADVEADAPLALQRDHALVELANAEHRAIEGDDLGLADLRIRQRIERAVLSQDLDDVFREGVERVPRHRRSVRVLVARSGGERRRGKRCSRHKAREQ